ncbi:aminoacyl-tRNA hydrolase [Rosettibacter firmus]|uniref:aminoacyl-tRNA hydrolase n=1 Tax=Rosettibacter firmus TaxID=3111522 RepID=UPI00336C2A6A
MYSVVGLGNPGKKYELTRHNIGFIILDRFAEKHNLHFKKKSSYYYVEGTTGSSTFFLIKPTTYMNLSGIAVQEFLSENKVEMENLLVVVDDVNLDLGKIRLRKTGSDGGHNGIKSIINYLQSNQFPRLRFGIGKDFKKDEMADYVLSEFTEDEFQEINNSINFSVELIEKFTLGGYKLMSDYYSVTNKKIL